MKLIEQLKSFEKVRIGLVLSIKLTFTQESGRAFHHLSKSDLIFSRHSFETQAAAACGANSSGP
jgi:hypothetical protein